MTPSAEWMRCTASEVQAAAGRDALVIVPVASLEQHGPHLCTGTDILLGGTVALETARRLREEEDVHGEVVVVGDVMIDVFELVAPRARGRTVVEDLDPGEYVLATAHRAGTVDDPERLRGLVALLRAVPLPVVLPLHPRTRARLDDAGLLDELAAGVALLPPLGSLDFTALLLDARAVLTDSGGVQKEAYLAGVPVGR